MKDRERDGKTPKKKKVFPQMPTGTKGGTLLRSVPPDANRDIRGNITI